MQLLAGVLLLGAALAAVVRAQDDRQVMIQALELDNADIRLVLKTIFQKADASFTIDPTLQGKVTMRVSNLPLHTVLDHVVRQVNAGYAIDQSGVYHFMPKARQAVPVPASSEGGVGIAYGDPYVFVVKGNRVFRMNRELKVLSETTLPHDR